MEGQSPESVTVSVPEPELCCVGVTYSSGHRFCHKSTNSIRAQALEHIFKLLGQPRDTGLNCISGKHVAIRVALRDMVGVGRQGLFIYRSTAYVVSDGQGPQGIPVVRRFP